MKKIVSLILIVVLVVSLCVGAFADTNMLKPGKSITPHIYNITSDPVISVIASGRMYDKIKIQLDIWDSDVVTNIPDKHWKNAFEATTFTISSGGAYLSIKPKKFHYVNSTRTPKARLRIWALSTNKDDVSVSYNKK